MDVVRRNINELGGSIEIRSELGKGSAFVIRLPLTLAILDGQTVCVGDETYIVPLVSIIESIQVKPEMINLVAGKGLNRSRQVIIQAMSGHYSGTLFQPVNLLTLHLGNYEAGLSNMVYSSLCVVSARAS